MLRIIRYFTEKKLLEDFLKRNTNAVVMTIDYKRHLYADYITAVRLGIQGNTDYEPIGLTLNKRNVKILSKKCSRFLESLLTSVNEDAGLTVGETREINRKILKCFPTNEQLAILLDHPEIIA